MTVISAPRMMPRTVNSLMCEPAVRPLLAILFSLEVHAGARRRRGRMTADRLPAALILHPDVGQYDAILDHTPEVFEPPAGLHGANHKILESGRVLHLDVDCVDLAALDGLEPFVAGHPERACRARSDQHEILMNQRRH